MNTTTGAESSPDTLVRVMLRAWAGEPLPDIGTPDFWEFESALHAVIREAKPLDMQRLGCAAAKALLRYLQDGLQAQQAAALAELRARGGVN